MVRLTIEVEQLKRGHLVTSSWLTEKEFCITQKSVEILINKLFKDYKKECD